MLLISGVIIDRPFPQDENYAVVVAGHPCQPTTCASADGDEATLCRHFAVEQTRRMGGDASDGLVGRKRVEVLLDAVLYNVTNKGFCHAWVPATGDNVFVPATAVVPPGADAPNPSLTLGAVVPGTLTASCTPICSYVYERKPSIVLCMCT